MSTWEEAVESDPLAEMDGKPISCRVCGTKCNLAGDTVARTVASCGETHQGGMQLSSVIEATQDTTYE